jgi:glycerol-3-phosphate O-acyltransferase/dihydroxyacetone phosphate acyltransferase
VPRRCEQDGSGPRGTVPIVSRTEPDRPPAYRFLKILAWIVVKVVFRRVDVTGGSRLVEGRPTVIAANHTNGLADPVLMVGKLPGLPSFLAGRDLWRFPPARFLFWLAHVLPVTRRRDGADPNGNESVFAACHEALAHGAHIALFPEGGVHLEPSMIPLKTGTARIALGAAADDGTPGITILPIGLVYDDKGRFRSQAAIHIGHPIEVDDWVTRYREDGPDAVRGLTNLLALRLHDLTLNHASWEEAAVVDRAAAITILGERDAGPREPVFAERSALSRALAAAIRSSGGEDGAAFRGLAAAIEDYRRDLALLGIDSPRAVPRLHPGWIRLRLARLAVGSVALMPFAGVGMVLNGAIVPVAHLVKARVKHPAWQTTAKGLTGLFLLPMLWGTETTIAYRRFGARTAIAVAAAGPIGGAAWIAWRVRWLRWRRTAASLEWFRRPDEALAAARASREAVLEHVAALVGEPALARIRAEA